ncbi:hypothetical protein L218DRAFT_940658 [Marasmius fiardii PR-910]|nr:hypothetical protein L218DRAFT_940658 [Marasmius fiardii PR-910]
MSSSTSVHQCTTYDETGRGRPLFPPLSATDQSSEFSMSPPTTVPSVVPRPACDRNDRQLRWPGLSERPSILPLPTMTPMHNGNLSEGNNSASAMMPPWDFRFMVDWSNHGRAVLGPEPYVHPTTVSVPDNCNRVWPYNGRSVRCCNNIIHPRPREEGVHLSNTQLPTDPGTAVSTGCGENISGAQVASPNVIRAAESRRKTVAKFCCNRPGCGQTFTTNQGLNNHEKAHLGIKEFLNNGFYFFRDSRVCWVLLSGWELLTSGIL